MSADARDQQQPVISAELLAILVCPVDKQELRLEGERLICTVCDRAYPIEHGIPNMLVEDEPSADG